MNRGREKRHTPSPAPENYPVPHTPKKPILAVTGTKPDRICAICLGKLEPGTALTFCNCGKYFHMGCISELGECPLCGFVFMNDAAGLEKGGVDIEPEEEYRPDNDIIETVYQCPMCNSYVSEDSKQCECGAIFDTEEEVYLCPQCGHEVKPDSERCDKCGMVYDD